MSDYKLTRDAEDYWADCDNCDGTGIIEADLC